MRGRRLLVVLGLAALLAGCSPRLDVSSEEAFRKSVAAMKSKLEPKVQDDLVTALLAAGLAKAANETDSLKLQSELRDLLATRAGFVARLRDLEGMVYYDVLSKAGRPPLTARDPIAGLAKIWLDQLQSKAEVLERKLEQDRRYVLEVSDVRCNFGILPNASPELRSQFPDTPAMSFRIRNETKFKVTVIVLESPGFVATLPFNSPLPPAEDDYYAAALANAASLKDIHNLHCPTRLLKATSADEGEFIPVRRSFVERTEGELNALLQIKSSIPSYVAQMELLRQWLADIR